MKKIITLVACVFLLGNLVWADGYDEQLERHLDLIIVENSLSKTLDKSETDNSLWIQSVVNNGYLKVPFKDRAENYGTNVSGSFRWNEQISALFYGYFGHAVLRGRYSVHQNHGHGGLGVKFEKDKWVVAVLGYYGEGNSNLLGLVTKLSYHNKKWRNFFVVPQLELGYHYIRFKGTTSGITLKPEIKTRWLFHEFAELDSSIAVKLRNYRKQGSIANLTVLYNLGINYEITEALKVSGKVELEHGGGVTTSFLIGLGYHF